MEANTRQWQVQYLLFYHSSKPMRQSCSLFLPHKHHHQACDNRNPDRPVFFVTEDQEFGALRKFEANGNGWDSLHRDGRTTYLRILNESTYEWTTNLALARMSAATYYRNAEGIIYHEGLLYFTAKKTHTLFILDLQTMTYQSEYTGALFHGQGSFNAQPDQIFLGNYKRWIYFTEVSHTQLSFEYCVLAHVSLNLKIHAYQIQ